MNPLTRICLAIALLALPLGLARSAVAQGTPDGVTPSVEAICTGMSGAAYWLCVSYCEANDCDVDHESKECARLRENYKKVSGRSAFPCDGPIEK